MANHDKTAEAAAKRQGLASGITVVENLLKMSEISPASADTIQALKIPANSLVLNVKTIVKTAEGGAANIDVGDGNDDDGYDAAVDINATAGTVAGSVDGTDAYAEGVYYTAEDTIDVLVNSASVDAAEVYIVAEYIQLTM